MRRRQAGVVRRKTTRTEANGEEGKAEQEKEKRGEPKLGAIFVPISFVTGGETADKERLSWMR